MFTSGPPQPESDGRLRRLEKSTAEVREHEGTQKPDSDKASQGKQHGYSGREICEVPGQEWVCFASKSGRGRNPGSQEGSWSGYSISLLSLVLEARVKREIPGSTASTSSARSAECESGQDREASKHAGVRAGTREKGRFKLTPLRVGENLHPGSGSNRQSCPAYGSGFDQHFSARTNRYGSAN